MILQFLSQKNNRFLGHSFGRVAGVYSKFASELWVGVLARSEPAHISHHPFWLHFLPLAHSLCFYSVHSTFCELLSKYNDPMTFQHNRITYKYCQYNTTELESICNWNWAVILIKFSVLNRNQGIFGGDSGKLTLLESNDFNCTFVWVGGMHKMGNKVQESVLRENSSISETEKVLKESLNTADWYDNDAEKVSLSLCFHCMSAALMCADD